MRNPRIFSNVQLLCSYFILLSSFAQALRTFEFLLRTTIAIPVLSFFFLFIAIPLALLNKFYKPSNTLNYTAPLFYHIMKPIFNISCHVSGTENFEKAGAPCVILCGPHQSSMDVFIGASFVPGGTAGIGKKELSYIPFFNLFGEIAGESEPLDVTVRYLRLTFVFLLLIVWLAPIVLIDRSNTARAIETLDQACQTITENSLRLILFPEGTVGFHSSFVFFVSFSLSSFVLSCRFLVTAHPHARPPPATP